MCTLTWWIQDRTHYEVFFNRDESKSRPLALPPGKKEQDGVAFLAPTDPRGGGTWIGVNEHGVTLALLNAYEVTIPDEPSEGWRSRGEVISKLMPTTSLEGCREALSRLSPEHYPPFRLYGFFPDATGVKIAGWLCHESFTETDVSLPVSSSSFETEAVLSARADELKKLSHYPQPVPDELLHYHHAGSPLGPAYGVRMNRPDAQTWSISRLIVSEDEIVYRYEAEALDQAVPSESSEARLTRSS